MECQCYRLYREHVVERVKTVSPKRYYFLALTNGLFRPNDMYRRRSHKIPHSLEAGANFKARLIAARDETGKGLLGK